MPGSHNVTITYMFVKPASPNTDSWWKSMGRVNNATPLDKIEEGDSSVEVIDTGSNSGQVVVTTDGTARAKFRTDGSFAVGGSNLDSAPNITLNADGSTQFSGGNGLTTDHSLGIRASGTGLLDLRRDDSDQAIGIYNGGSSSANRVVQINGDGSATFNGLGTFQNTDETSNNPALVLRSAGGMGTAGHSFGITFRQSTNVGIGQVYSYVESNGHVGLSFSTYDQPNLVERVRIDPYGRFLVGRNSSSQNSTAWF